MRSPSASARPRLACSVCRRSTERHWSSNGERQIALEASVRAQLQGAEEAGKTHARDLGEIYQALVKLGANQQTLGDNFTAWRIESGGDIGIVSNRVQQLEQTMLDLLGHFGGELQALRQEKPRQRRRPSQRLQALALRHRQRLRRQLARRHCPHRPADAGSSRLEKRRRPRRSPELIRLEQDRFGLNDFTPTQRRG